MSLLRRSKRDASPRHAPGGSDGESPFKIRVESADGPGVITGVLGVQNGAVGAASASGWRSALDMADLGHDDSIEGLTIDQVSVVRIGDRAVVVPVALDLALQSGFDVIPTSPEALFAIGVRPVPGAPVPVAVRPGTSQTAFRWDDPISEAAREPEIAVASFTGEPDDFMADVDPGPLREPGRERGASDPDAHDAALPAPAVAVHDDDSREVAWFEEASFHSGPVDGDLVDGDPAAGDPADRDPVAESFVADPEPTRAESSAFDRAASDVAAPVEPARPQEVPGPDRYEWPVDASSPDWPVIERRINDRRAAPVLAWGHVEPSTPEPGVRDSGTRPVPADTVWIATGPDDRRPDTDADSEPIVAMVDVALHGSPTRRFGLRLAAGEVVVVTGEGGSGKSSLLRVLAGMEAPAAGHVLVDGVAMESLTDDQRLVREAVCDGFVSSAAHLVPDLRVIENIELPLLVRGIEPHAARASAEELLERWQIAGLAERGAGTLSTTEQRCVVLARALIGDNRLVLADDPTIGVAADVAGDIVGLLLEQARLGATVIIVTSDPRVVVEGVRLLTLRAGDIVADEWVPNT